MWRHDRNKPRRDHDTTIIMPRISEIKITKIFYSRQIKRKTNHIFFERPKKQSAPTKQIVGAGSETIGNRR